GGPWNDKSVSENQGERGRLISDYIQSRSHLLRTAKIATENLSAAIRLGDENFAVITREYSSFKKKGTELVPIFSLLDEPIMEKFASNLGLSNEDFIGQHVFNPWARALAEMAAIYGWQPNSAHPQDYLVVFKDGKPTGEIVIRDVMDAKIDINFVGDDPEMLHQFEKVLQPDSGQNDLVKGEINVAAKPFHLNYGPHGMKFEPLIFEMNQIFVNVYHTITGIQLPLYETGLGMNVWDTLDKNPHYERWVRHIKEIGQIARPVQQSKSAAGSCQRIFK
ncbi:MAG: hypothetical protein AAF203_10570, partial [Pseudomonadota bacterium]